MRVQSAEISTIVKEIELRQSEEYANLTDNELRDLATSEAVAEMSETMLTDTDAAERVSRRLQQQDKSLWQKIKDYFSGLVERLKKAYKGMEPDSKIAQQTREVIAQNEKILDAYVNAVADAVESYNNQNGQKNNAQEGENNVRYSVRTVNGQKIVWIENSGLTNKQLKNHQAIADYIAEHIGEVYTVIETGDRVYIGEDLPSEYTHSTYTSYLQQKNKTVLKAKNKAVDGLGEMIEIASNRRWEATRHSSSKDAKYGMYRYDSKFAFPIKDSAGKNVDVKAYDVELLIRNASDGEKYLYDIVNITENTANVLDFQQRETRNGNASVAAQSGASTDSILTDAQNVNQQNIRKSSRNLEAQNQKLEEDVECLKSWCRFTAGGTRTSPSTGSG